MKSNFYLKSLLRRISKVLLLSRLRDCVEPDRNTFRLTHNRVDPFLLFGRIELNSENSEARCQKGREEEVRRGGGEERQGSGRRAWKGA